MKTALITGSAKRLGREIALSLTNDGWEIIVHHNKTAPDAELVKLAKAVVQADLLNFNELPELFRHGKIDLLVNSASVYEKKSFAASTEQDFDDNINIHLKAPYFLSQLFAKQATNGHIINIVDAFTKRSKTNFFPYLLSKKALLDLTKMLAAELAPNIRVNAILPGVMREFSTNLDPEFLAKRKALIPQGDFASSADVVKTIKFLNETSLTGQEIYVDAGEQLI